MKNKKILTLALIIISTIGVLELKNGNIKEPNKAFLVFFFPKAK